MTGTTFFPRLFIEAVVLLSLAAVGVAQPPAEKLFMLRWYAEPFVAITSGASGTDAQALLKSVAAGPSWQSSLDSLQALRDSRRRLKQSSQRAQWILLPGVLDLKPAWNLETFETCKTGDWPMLNKAGPCFTCGRTALVTLCPTYNDHRGKSA